MRQSWWRHPVVIQWAWLLAFILAAVTAANLSGLLWRLDLSVYDAALPTGTPAPDLVIVAIDDASIAALGRWPWRRAVHAALLDRLHAMGARAVALDVLFTEADPVSPAGDAALAAAMTRGPPTVLPLLVEAPGPGRGLRERLPIPELAQAAVALGHANLEVDRDGMVRSVFLREGLGAPNRSYFAAALLEHAPGAGPLTLQGARHPDLANAPPVWVRDFRMWIPFLGPPGRIPQFSYVDVLAGAVPADAVAGKLVFVGGTAAGIGDSFPTPRSGEGRDMPGVEIAANVALALREGRTIHPVSGWQTSVIAWCPILLAAAALLLMPPTPSLVAIVLIWFATLAGSVLALRAGGWWWPPGATLAALLVMYPLWGWRRLEVSQAFIEAQFKLLAEERFPLLTRLPAPVGARPPVDFVEQRIELLRLATERLRAVRGLFSDTLNSLPVAILLAEQGGRIVLANPAAAALFGVADYRSLEGSGLDAQLFDRTGAPELRFAALAGRAPQVAEASFHDTGRNVLARSVPFFDGAGGRVGTIIALADITELRAAQRERDEVLRFLSHDMKSPASSLLGLAQLQRDAARALPPAELSQRLDLLAHRLLTLVDGFLALARAEAADPAAFDEFDLRDAVQDAYDEVWATAQARGSAITVLLPDQAQTVRGDRQLIARAIINLLGNALKFSPAGAPITLDLHASGGEAIVAVADRGPGIDPAAAAALFRRFSRGLHRGTVNPDGAGMGLAFVRIIAEKHGGHAWADPNAPEGARFYLRLPLAVELTASPGEGRD